jgi:hypothetical protein
VAATAATTREVAATAATSEVSVRKRDNRRAGHGRPEQQGCDNSDKSRVRRTHSSSPLCCRDHHDPAAELDAPGAPVFKLTHIKTR